MTRPKKVAVIVVAAGRGERASIDGDTTPKQYRLLAGLPVLSRTIKALLAHESIAFLVPVIHPDHEARYAALGLADERLLPPVHGGATRQASVLRGMESLSKIRPDYVLIHDAARPFVSPEIIEGVISSLDTSDGALPAVPVTDTIKKARDGKTVISTEDRSVLFAAQTPQGFRYPQLLSAHMRATSMPREFTDDAAIAEWAGLTVTLSPGSTDNIKITRPEDFARAERMLGVTRMETRVGSGFDVHPFEPGDHVWLGGVRIPHTHTLKGHSDADAALHALTDAIYGALGEGDIGTHFPPSDMQWRGAASTIFLEHAAGLVTQRGGRIVNLDITIVCELPRINPHVAAMRSVIAASCAIAETRIAIKATTSEQLGFTGREEGIVAMATATIELPYA